MNKKQAAISCLEIVPGAIYLAPRRDEKSLKDCPVTVTCTQEPGWLRGFVHVHVRDAYRSVTKGLVTVRFIEDGATADIPVYRSHVEGSPWVFATGPEKYEPNTLRVLPADWFAHRIQSLELDRNMHIKKIGEIEDLISTVKVLQTKAEQHAS